MERCRIIALLARLALLGANLGFQLRQHEHRMVGLTGIEFGLALVRLLDSHLTQSDQIDEIVNENQFDLYDLQKYYRLHLSYELDDPKRRSLDKFLSLI